MKKKVMSAVMGLLFLCAMSGLSVASSDVAGHLDSSVQAADATKAMEEVKTQEHGQDLQEEAGKTAEATKEEAMEHVSTSHE